MRTVKVEFTARGFDEAYPICVERGLLDRAGEIAERLAARGGVKFSKGAKAAVISDSTVVRLYGDRLIRSLADAGFAAFPVVIPAGEASKSLATLERVYDALAAAGLSRSDSVVALGGGVVGDLAGFAAATYLRGISYAQVPTTLLAQVDSSVGGKTGIDLARGKNLVGAFWQPRVVIVDPALLESLPEDVFQDGLGEMAKHAAIADPGIFTLLGERPDPAALGERLEEALARNLEIKAAVVSRDALEAGERMLLNFGHTIGHAVEAALGYGTLSHGKCVAIGMAAITRNSEALGASESGTADALCAALERLGLPTEVPELDAARYAAAAALDKKGSGLSITLALLRRVGAAYLKRFPREEAAAYLKIGGKEAGR